MRRYFDILTLGIIFFGFLSYIIKDNNAEIIRREQKIEKGKEITAMLYCFWDFGFSGFRM